MINEIITTENYSIVYFCILVDFIVVPRPQDYRGGSLVRPCVQREDPPLDRPVKHPQRNRSAPCSLTRSHPVTTRRPPPPETPTRSTHHLQMREELAAQARNRWKIKQVLEDISTLCNDFETWRDKVVHLFPLTAFVTQNFIWLSLLCKCNYTCARTRNIRNFLIIYM